MEQTSNHGTEALQEFAAAIGLDHLVPGRYSALFLKQLFSRRSEYLNVRWEIAALEREAWSTSTKPATRFERAPFAGLWHKHYQVGGVRSLAINLERGLKDGGTSTIDRLTRKAEASGVPINLSEADLRRIVHESVYDNFMTRATMGKMTGEWIVFARHDDRNYYLALGEHDKSGHAALRAAIDTTCVVEFPFLRQILDHGA